MSVHDRPTQSIPLCCSVVFKTIRSELRTEAAYWQASEGQCCLHRHSHSAQAKNTWSYTSIRAYNNALYSLSKLRNKFSFNTALVYSCNLVSALCKSVYLWNKTPFKYDSSLTYKFSLATNVSIMLVMTPKRASHSSTLIRLHPVFVITTARRCHFLVSVTCLSRDPWIAYVTDTWNTNMLFHALHWVSSA
jgi:hypothetical protein